jgi:hypothetical protein
MYVFSLWRKLMSRLPNSQPAALSGGRGEKDRQEVMPCMPTLRFYGDEFVFDTASGMFYRISLVASFILNSLQAGTHADELASLIETQFGIDPSRAARDVELFLGDLTALKLIDGPIP